MIVNSQHQYEYRCPACRSINVLPGHELANTYKEFERHCSSCGKLLEVVSANGLGEMVNLIVSESVQDHLKR